jgi:type IV pilus assembly protein PilV
MQLLKHQINSNMKASAFNKQSGATLIEILVSVLILSFGLLGMAALQTRALQGNQSSVQRSQAIMLSQYMMDAMRVDRENARGSLYNINYTCGPDGISGTETLAKNNLRNWLGNIETGLGVAADTTSCGSISCSAAYECTVRIKWDDSRVTGGLGEQVVTLTSTL